MWLVVVPEGRHNGYVVDYDEAHVAQQLNNLVVMSWRVVAAGDQNYMQHQRRPSRTPLVQFRTLATRSLAFALSYFTPLARVLSVWVHVRERELANQQLHVWDEFITCRNVSNLSYVLGGERVGSGRLRGTPMPIHLSRNEGMEWNGGMDNTC